MIIQFIGPSGAGKTTIADAVRDRTNSLHIGISNIAETETANAIAMLGRLARLMQNKQDKHIIVDFVGKNKEARDAFGPADIVVWVDTVAGGEDWEDPETYTHRITNTGDDHTDAMPTRAITIVRKFGLLDWKPEQTLMAGTFQNWTEADTLEYNRLSAEGPVTIGIKHSVGMKPENSLFINQIRDRILSDIPGAHIVVIPNVITFKDMD